MAYGTNAPFGLKPIATTHGGPWVGKLNPYTIYASADGQSTYANPIFKNDLISWGTSSQGATPTTNGAIGTITEYKPNYDNTPTPGTFGVGGISAAGIGVFVGCDYVSTTGEIIKESFWPGGVKIMPGTSITAYVLDDPSVIFDVQVSTHINAAGDPAKFVGQPLFPNTNATGGGAFIRSGSFGRNFAINVGGGTNFNTVTDANNEIIGYANNPTRGNTRTGESAQYLDVDTSEGAQYNNKDYSKIVTNLPLRALCYSPLNIPAVGETLATTPFLNVWVTLNNPNFGHLTPPTTYVA